MTYEEHIRLKMIEIRKLHNLGQRAFGERTGIPHFLVTRLETGRRIWQLKHIELVCKAFCIDPKSLMPPKE